LEDNMGREHLGWDQFALNESRFGVKTDYNEEFYTTTLDPTKSKISVAEAARIAREIERGDKSGVTNIHILEERGIEIDDGDMDEEARYGAVIRENPAPQAAGHPAGAWGRGPPTASVPISIDSRKEANKVRAHMTSGKSTSPYGTPKTQLTSPLVSDAQKLEALNLDPGVAHVDAATRREFEVFKAEQAKKGAPPPTLSDFKQFSQQVGTKLQKTSSNAASETTATSSSVGGGEAGETPSSEKKATTSTLNPNAKSFSFNINARSFTPTFTPGAGAQAKPAAAPAPVPGPGSAPVAVPTPSGNRTPGSEGRPGPMRSQDGDGGHGYAHNNARRYDDYPRDDRRDMRAGGGMRPPPPPPEGSMPPPPPPGRSPPGGGPGHMAMAGMGVPSMMVPVMMQSGPHGMMYRPVQGAPQMFMPTGQPYMMRPPMIMTPTGVPLQMVPAGMGYPGPGAGYPPGAGPGVHRGDGDGGDR